MMKKQQLILIIISYLFPSVVLINTENIKKIEAYNKRLIDSSITMHSIPLSPDRINKLVAERSAFRAARDYNNADNIKLMLEKDGVTITDYPYRQNRESSWTWSAAYKHLQNYQDDQFNILSFAHHISMERMMRKDVDESSVINMVRNRLLSSNITIPIIRGDGEFVSEEKVSINIDSSMQGRKYVDAAFEFAFCGIKDKQLFELLADRAEDELIRFGARISCRPVNILQIVEKLAVAGVTKHSIYQTAYALLDGKRKLSFDIDSGKLPCKEEIVDICTGKLEVQVEEDNDDELEEEEDEVVERLSMTTGTFSDLAANDLSLFSSRSLLMLWRFAAKQKKAGLQIEADPSEENMSAATTAPTAFEEIFADPSLPLVIDIGCGYGVYLLRLCDLAARNHSLTQGNYRQLNYLGVDMNRRCILYANGLTSRWGMESNCAFLEMDSLTCLDFVLNNYPGAVTTVLINFPTPYNIALLSNGDNVEMLESKEEKEEGGEGGGAIEPTDRDLQRSATGNAQLPDRLDHFMCNKILVGKILEIFRSKRPVDTSIPQLVYVQSNVEDVAVTMRDVILTCEARTQSRSGEDRDSRGQLPEGGFYLPRSAEDVEMYAADVLFAPTSRRMERATVGGLSDTDSPIDWVCSEGSGMDRETYSLRDKKWIEMLSSQPDSASSGANHPHNRRAFGRGWLNRSPFALTKTETEAYCEQMGKRVHRSVFVFGKKGE